MYNKFLEKSIEAMLSSIEIYNKPNSFYREENFCILCINSWELFLKSKILKDSNNSMESLYIKKDSKEGFKMNRNNTPMTMDIISCINHLNNKNNNKYKNIAENLKLLIEIRDQATHSVISKEKIELIQKINEISQASVKNYFKLMEEWFSENNLKQYNFCLLPISFINNHINDTILNSDSYDNLLDLINDANLNSDKNSNYDIFLKIKIEFTKSEDNVLKINQKTKSGQECKIVYKNIDSKYCLNFNTLRVEVKKKFKYNDKIYRDFLNSKIKTNSNLSFKYLQNPNNDNKFTYYYSREVIDLFKNVLEKK